MKRREKVDRKMLRFFFKLVKIKKFSFAFSFLVLQLCLYCRTSPVDYEESRIISKITKVAKDNYDLELCGNGFCNDIFVNKIRGLNFSFKSRKIVESDEARVLSIKMVLDCLKIINASKNFKTHMYEYPFGPKNINLSILSSSSLEKSIVWPDVAFISFISNSLVFCYEEKKVSRRNFNPFKDLNLINHSERLCLSMQKVKSKLDCAQLTTAKRLGFFQSEYLENLVSCDVEAQNKTLTKEMLTLTHTREKKIKESSYEYHEIKKRYELDKSVPWEKDANFKNEKEKQEYFFKMKFLRGEEKWTPFRNFETNEH